ncbi:IPP transferase-domain-containing protein [Dimargaris cristalligena]|uniref:tRNA dimethylallyltransferase n=1 Tax=Dimargaris cristalligena TaxID=215637 RepID=A0A4P9ZJX7_9FUNG|nr:IPP transferase-domain-containing protein [Dimargaris cristalligena]|eukprot:RKP33527.1 IPP transferase-domain-containing protein [Dimargaris cristalligena]
MLKQVVAVIGSTGVGKSQLAVELAKAFGGEIINADAMQMYQGFDILTNKVTPGEQEGIPHHLLGCLSPNGEYSVTDFEKDALKKIAEIQARDRLPILVGGTHYYVQAVLWNQSLVSNRAPLPSQPSTAPFPGLTGEVQDFNSLDNPALYRLLNTVDPTMAQQWHPNDRRKLVRSLEVYRDTGRPHSEWIRETQTATHGSQRLRFPTCIFWVGADPPTLNPRLDSRVDQMVQRGLLSELEELRRLEPVTVSGDRDYTRGILQAIGLKEFEPMLQQAQMMGVADYNDPQLDEARTICLERMKIGTRQYAKRQIAWIRNKLLPLFRATEVGPPASAFYLLDANHLDAWSARVRDTAVDVNRAFLASGPLLDPIQVNPAAAPYLNPGQTGPLRSVGDWKKHTCPECTEANQGTPLVLNGQAEWEAHRTSRRHRRSLKWLKVQKDKLKYRSTSPASIPDSKPTGATQPRKH